MKRKIILATLCFVASSIASSSTRNLTYLSLSKTYNPESSCKIAADSLLPRVAKVVGDDKLLPFCSKLSSESGTSDYGIVFTSAAVDLGKFEVSLIREDPFELRKEISHDWRLVNIFNPGTQSIESQWVLREVEMINRYHLTPPTEEECMKLLAARLHYDDVKSSYIQAKCDGNGDEFPFKFEIENVFLVPEAADAP
jgi:hypothetical protein